MKRTPHLLPLCLLCALLLTGCGAKQYSIAVETRANPEAAASAKTYMLRPMSDAVEPTDSFYRNLATQVNTMLAGQGYTLVDSPDKASQLISLLYIGKSSQRTETYNVPYSTQGGTTANRSGGTIYYNHHPQTSGYRQQTVQVMTYQSDITLSSRPIVNGKVVETGPELWKASATSSGPDSTLPEVFPTMMNVLKDRIGTTSNETVKVAAEK